MSADKLIIISTHILEEVEAVCSRAIIIAEGRLLVDDTPEALAAQGDGDLDMVVIHGDGTPGVQINAGDGAFDRHELPRGGAGALGSGGGGAFESFGGLGSGGDDVSAKLDAMEARAMLAEAEAAVRRTPRTAAACRPRDLSYDFGFSTATRRRPRAQTRRPHCARVRSTSELCLSD